MNPLTFILALFIVIVVHAPTVHAAAIAPTDKKPWPEHVFAPYVDVVLWPTPKIDELAKASGARHVTLAFVVADSGGGKSACWGGYATYPVARESTSNAESDFAANLITGINNLRAAGGDIMISFGGANGTPIDSRFTDTKELTAEYQRVIDTYHLKAIDLDIEGAWSADASSIARRSAAIKSLQAANPGLKVWFTLAVLPTGLTADGLTILESALDAGVRIDGVNLMAMDYGDGAAPNPKDKMATYAIAAAGAVHAQMKTLLADKHVKFTDAALWSTIGVTPMIGINDTQTEIFDPPAARQLLTFARQKKLGLVSFWSLTRDHPGKGSVNATNSGLPQEDFAFSTIFSAFDRDEPHGSPSSQRRIGVSVSPKRKRGIPKRRVDPRWRFGLAHADISLPCHRRRTLTHLNFPYTHPLCSGKSICFQRQNGNAFTNDHTETDAGDISDTAPHIATGVLERCRIGGDKAEHSCRLQIKRSMRRCSDELADH